MVQVKKIVAREGLIIIGLILMSVLCFQLESWKPKDFDDDGKRVLTKKEIEQFNLFQPDQRKTQGFDPYTAIPVQKPTFKLSQVTAPDFDPSTAKPIQPLPREDYEELAKKELLNRKGFAQSGGHFIPDDVNDETQTRAYLAKRELLRREMRTWTEEHLAAMAHISLEHFEKACKKIGHLKRRINIDFSSLGFFFLLFAYPLYLFVSFIIWAIRTLLQKS